MSEKIQENKGKTVKFELNERTLWRAGTLVFGLLFVLSLITDGFGFANKAPPSPTLPGVPAAPEAQPVLNIETPSDSIFKGDKDAPITIVEFSDFQCPFCGKFYQQTLPQIQQQYIDTGKVKFVYRHLPLSFHPYAQKAAEASECANDQGKFWEYHDIIFQNQDALNADIFSQWAKDLGMNVKEFEACLSTGKYTAKVNRDNADAAKYGASGTPTFFINSKKIVGAQPFAAFKSIIDQELGA